MGGAGARAGRAGWVTWSRGQTAVEKGPWSRAPPNLGDISPVVLHRSFMGEGAKSHELPGTLAARRRSNAPGAALNMPIGSFQICSLSDLDHACCRGMNIWMVFPGRSPLSHSLLITSSGTDVAVSYLAGGEAGECEVRSRFAAVAPHSFTSLLLSPSFFTRLAPLTPVVIYG